MVGLGGLEPPTSSLSGMRSSHLSYRPRRLHTWWSWSGSNRRPPECKSGALPAELQPLNFRAGSPAPDPHQSIEASWMQRPRKPVHGRLRKTLVLSVEIRIGLTMLAEAAMAVWSGTTVSYRRTLYTQAHLCFRKLHPRSLLERR